MFSKVDYVMVNVSDMSRSVAFYRDVLGLPLKFESPGWSEFQTGATTLALHHVPARVGAQGRAPAEPAAGTCSIGFSVEDIEATHRELVERGARFVLAPTDQVNEGIRLAVCVDPDGLAVSFAQPLTRLPPKSAQ
jgi:lactoylglutathione lyase